MKHSLLSLLIVISLVKLVQDAFNLFEVYLYQFILLERIYILFHVPYFKFPILLHLWESL